MIEDIKNISISNCKIGLVYEDLGNETKGIYFGEKGSNVKNNF